MQLLPTITPEAIEELERNEAAAEDHAALLSEEQPEVVSYVFNLYSEQEDEELRDEAISKTLSTMAFMYELMNAQELINEAELEAEATERAAFLEEYLDAAQKEHEEAEANRTWIDRLREYLANVISAIGDVFHEIAYHISY